jgi:diguanylate cyclase (GGDEF)-like protein
MNPSALAGICYSGQTAIIFFALLERDRFFMGSSQTLPSVSAIKVWQKGSRRDRLLVFGGWALAVFLSVWLGLQSVIYSWSGLPIRFGGVEVYITVYPPLVICLWWSLCFGFWWGAIPAYFATLTLALYAGMDLPWAVLFSCADPLGFMVFIFGYRAISVSKDLRSLNSLLFFMQLSFVASVFGSSGALVWSYTNRIDSTALLAIWQGWWLGFFLQSTCLVAPILWFTRPLIDRWQAKHPGFLVPPQDNPRQNVSRMALAMVGGVLAYGFLTIQLGAGQVQLALRPGEAGLLPGAAQTLVATSWVFFWVFGLIVVFIGFFGFQIFSQWLAKTDRLVSDLARANQDLALAAETDVLTGLGNRRAIARHLGLCWHRFRRYGESYCLVLIDLDHFKAINDEFGHDVGDLVLRDFAKNLQACVRAIDAVGRWGGEEFLVILPNVDADGASRFAGRLRETVGNSAVRLDELAVRYDFSAGLALSDPADDTTDAWMRRADQALLDAKRRGRGQSILALPASAGASVGVGASS